jgi:hypothetical protein
MTTRGAKFEAAGRIDYLSKRLLYQVHPAIESILKYPKEDFIETK